MGIRLDAHFGVIDQFGPERHKLGCGARSTAVEAARAVAATLRCIEQDTLPRLVVERGDIGRRREAGADSMRTDTWDVRQRSRQRTGLVGKSEVAEGTEP